MDSSSGKKNNFKKDDIMEALRISMRLSVWIAFPVVVGAILGKWLDRKYNSEPKWFLIIIGLAFVVSMFGMIRDALNEMKKIDRKK